MMNRFIPMGVVVLSVGLLAGCPKAPEVGQTPPAAIAAQAPTPATPPSARPTPPPGDIQVTRPAPPVEVPVSPAPPTGPALPTRPTGPVMPATAPLKDIFFGFDSATLRDDQKAALNVNVTWLKANPAAKITIEGHADERGTNEYNLGLGDRRAKATRDYLVAAGIEATRIVTISYGEERPFVLGHDETAWQGNRRAHFAIPSR